MKCFSVIAAVMLMTVAASSGNTNRCLQLNGTNSAVFGCTNTYGGRLRSFTVSAWVCPATTSTLTNQIIVERILSMGPVTRRKFCLGINTTGHPFILYDSLGGYSSTLTASATIESNTWHHIAGSFDHTSNHLKLFLNGTLAAAYAEIEEPVYDISPFVGSTAIGAHNRNPTADVPTLEHFLAGRVDEVQLWHGACSAVQIFSNMCAKPGGMESNLVGYWNYDDGTMQDSTTNENNGTLYGDAALVANNITYPARLEISCTGQVSVIFQTIEDTFYGIDFNASLDGKTWTAVTDDVVGDGGVVTIEETVIREAINLAAGVNSGFAITAAVKGSEGKSLK